MKDFYKHDEDFRNECIRMRKLHLLDAKLTSMILGSQKPERTKFRRLRRKVRIQIQETDIWDQIRDLKDKYERNNG